MSNSSLVSYTRISPNKTSPRRNKIDRITIHHMAGNLSVETCGNVFVPSSRQASSNYGIGSDGRVGMYVEEKDRSWCSSSSANDHRAVTIEVADDGRNPWHCSDAAMNTLVELCADICRRNGIPKLIYTGDTRGNLTMHKWFAATDCPGNFLESRFQWIADEVNKKLGASTAPCPSIPEIDNKTTYAVQKGDTLYGISKKFNMSVDQLKSLNGLVSNTIYVGQVLKVSGSIPSPSPAPSQTLKPNPVKPSGNQIVKDGQIHARNFAVPGLSADGIRGVNTIKAGIKVLQQAMNLDYRAGLVVDGIWGTKSERALGKHTVRKGETQYMVTALQILLMLKGYNPNGLENPGTFGSGCEKAVRQYQSDRGLGVDGVAGYKTFKSLIA